MARQGWLVQSSADVVDIAHRSSGKAWKARRNMRTKYSFVSNAGIAAVDYQLTQTAITQFFQQQKAERGATAAAASHTQQVALQALGDDNSAHPVLHAYEKAHLQIGYTTIDALMVALRLHLRQARAGWSFLFHANGTDVEVRGKDRPDAPFQLLGTIYKGDQRFIAVAPAVPNVLNPLYVRRDEPTRHYVQLPDGTYLRRFVTRGFNQNDSICMELNLPLGAPCQIPTATQQDIFSPHDTSRSGRHNVPVGAALTLNDKVLSHTRGWQKRFISATTTKRPVFSTRGEQFRSLFGAALIDLAQVPLASVVDLHRPDRVQPLLGVPASTIATTAQAEPAYPRTTDDERFLAARDVIRTREVLIHQQVPPNAVVAVPGNLNVVGIFSNNTNDNAFAAILARDVSGRVIQATEVLEYPWRNFRWTFLEFASPADATHAMDIVGRLKHILCFAPNSLRCRAFRQYSIPAVRPAGF
jgi:hypothetical protein